MEPVAEFMAMRDGVDFKNQMRRNIMELKQKINFNSENKLTEEIINTKINYVPRKLGESKGQPINKSRVKKGGIKLRDLMEE